MKIIGLKFFGHDCSVCMIDTEKKELFAISSERVTRKKHDASGIDSVVGEYRAMFAGANIYCHSFDKFETSSSTAIEHWEYCRGNINKWYKTNGDTIKFVLGSLLYGIERIPFNLGYCRHIKRVSREITKRSIVNSFRCKNEYITFAEHHLCHAFSAYYTSKYINKKALVVTLDGYGDGCFSKAYIFDKKEVLQVGMSAADPIYKKLTRLTNGVTSIGILYENFTEALGLRRNSDEGKVEALAAFGIPDAHLLESLLETTRVKFDGIKIDKRLVKKFYDINYLKSIRTAIGDKNFAATIQRYLETVVCDYINVLGSRYPDVDHLCLAGGVAANIIMNLAIYEKTRFRNVHICPAMGDDGTALGAAIYTAVSNGQEIGFIQNMHMPYFGDSIADSDVTREADIRGLSCVELKEDWCKVAADDITSGKIIAVVQGRMEFGPRALGNRSIIADPRDPNIKTKINSTVKRRPEYQPFCPSILEEDRVTLFEDSFSHKHMAIAFRMRDKYREIFPGATHIDGTARPQFVSKEDNYYYWNLLKEVKDRIGIGIVINTSFNLHGRTIVRTAKDAIDDFLDCGIDVLYINGIRITR